MTPDSFLFDAGSLFFAAWIAVLAAVSITAFGRDLLPAKSLSDPSRKIESADRSAIQAPH